MSTAARAGKNCPRTARITVRAAIHTMNPVSSVMTAAAAPPRGGRLSPIHVRTSAATAEYEKVKAHKPGKNERLE